MHDHLKGFSSSTVDWRAALARNRRRTFWVIMTFILIYAFVGLLIDVYFYAGHYPALSLSDIAYYLITLRLRPFFTLITLLVALVSVWVTFRFYNRLMLLGTAYREVVATTSNGQEKQLYHIVEEMTLAAGLNAMPKVYVIDADYMNAFASGYSERSAMIAVTQGLLNKLNREELTAVMAHELSHIRHMDIKLTLMASVLSNLTLMLLDVLFFSALFGNRGGREDRQRSNILFFIILALRYLLPWVTLLLTFYLSRTREYMADSGCIELMRTNTPLASALLKIEADYQQHAETYSEAYARTPHESTRRSAYIFDPTQLGIQSGGGMFALFSTHPTLKKRLKAIGYRSHED